MNIGKLKVGHVKLPTSGFTHIYIGRHGSGSNHEYNLGNPFTVKEYGRGNAINLYSGWLNEVINDLDHEVTLAIKSIMTKLRSGEDIELLCFCYPDPCHGHILRNKIISLLLMEMKR